METVAFPSTCFTVLIKRALMFMLQEVLIWQTPLCMGKYVIRKNMTISKLFSITLREKIHARSLVKFIFAEWFP